MCRALIPRLATAVAGEKMGHTRYFSWALDVFSFVCSWDGCVGVAEASPGWLALLHRRPGMSSFTRKHVFL
jgi:hypothetical protein